MRPGQSSFDTYPSLTCRAYSKFPRENQQGAFSFTPQWSHDVAVVESRKPQGR